MDVHQHVYAALEFNYKYRVFCILLEVIPVNFNCLYLENEFSNNKMVKKCCFYILTRGAVSKKVSHGFVNTLYRSRLFCSTYLVQHGKMIYNVQFVQYSVT